MTASTTSTTPIPQATPAQQRAFCRLRERYQHNQDRFAPTSGTVWCFSTGSLRREGRAPRRMMTGATTAEPREHDPAARPAATRRTKGGRRDESAIAL